MGIKKDLPVLFVNPLEVRHYILDLPPIKNTFKENAVRFSLRSLYPGNEDSTEIDYYTAGTKTVGLALPKEKYIKLTTQKQSLISAAKIISIYGKDGLYVTSNGEWIEIVCKKNSTPVFQKSFLSSQKKAFLHCFTEIQHSEDYQDLESFFLYIKNDNDYEAIPELEGYSKQLFFTMFSEKQCRKQELFLPHSKQSKASLPFLSIGIIIILISGLVNYSLFKKACDLETKATLLNQQYESVKAEKSKPEIKTTINEIQANSIQENSPYLYFQEIYKSAPSLKIKSFTLDKHSFRFEAENAKALDVLNYLQETEIFYDVTLHQAIPDDNGKEHFSISGKIAQ